MSEPVLTEVSDGIAVITINRPEARNAVNGAVARGMAAAIDELEANGDVRVLILTGAGGYFSAGMDLKGFLSGDAPVAAGRGFGGIAQPA
jgi:enoyl-CoA hydratase